MSQQQTTAIIGLGSMGYGIASSMLRAGHKSYGFDVAAQAVERFVAEGGSTGDMVESIELSEQNKINPSFMITHVGGLESAPHTILNQLEIPGGKKLIYPHIDLPLPAIDDFLSLGDVDPFFEDLDAILKANNYGWNAHAEKALLEFYDVSLSV